jgi:hypothetical protein
MSQPTKMLFELPKLIGLDGSEVTEDKLLAEITADRLCLGGGHNCSSGGAAPKEPVEEEVA